LQNLPCLADAFKKADEELQEVRQAVGKREMSAQIIAHLLNSPLSSSHFPDLATTRP
jgi:hypothetical protein